MTIMKQEQQRKRAFVALQEKYVNALAIKCCPTMDLVAVLTIDRQLIVHRTISWQRLLHVKPSDVVFEMVMIEWSPDGLALSVGCEEGEVVVFDIESGEQVPERRGLRALDAFRHEDSITAMHWVQSNERRDTLATISHRQFCQRTTRFLNTSKGTIHSHYGRTDITTPGTAGNYSDVGRGLSFSGSPSTVLVTADAKGKIVLWWMGRVYLTMIDLVSQLQQIDTEIAALMKRYSSFLVDAVSLSPDLCWLFVVLVFTNKHNNSSGMLDASDGDTSKGATAHYLLTLDLTRLQHVQRDVEFVAQAADEVYTILNQLVLTMRQMTTEWKNATRVFELKMGLIGSLYEKYGCEDPPQVDMLCVVASGITSPALAQYFAQDIQEMSVHRMQKMMMSGCQTLCDLVEGKMNRGLVELLFHISELRGRVKWNQLACAQSIGLTVGELDELTQFAQDLLVEMETLKKALYETRQDFGLLFQWILERIRVHTNSLTDGSGAGISHLSGGNNEGGKRSLLDQRRFCTFLQKAAHEAHLFRMEQSAHNKYKVETTFGNPVSKILSKPKSGPVDQQSRCEYLIANLEAKWFAMMSHMAASICDTIGLNHSRSFYLGETVLEYHFHHRCVFGMDEDSERVEEDDEVDGIIEAVDWQSLKQFSRGRERCRPQDITVLGLRTGNTSLTLMQHFGKEKQFQRAGCPWKIAVPEFTENGTKLELQGFDFYGGIRSGRKEQLALLIRGAHNDSLYMQPYDHIPFVEVDLATTELGRPPYELHSVKACTLSIQADTVGLIPSSTAKNPLLSSRVIANGPRGIVSVISSPSRLIVFDAEDNEDNDGDNESVNLQAHSLEDRSRDVDL